VDSAVQNTFKKYFKYEIQTHMRCTNVHLLTYLLP